MGTTLTGTTPQDTYDSLIKVTDNGPLSSTGKYLSDGLGNDSALALSTANAGIKFIPSAWASGFTAMHVGDGGSVYSANSNRNIYLANNTYFDGTNFKYIASSYAGLFGLEDGSFVVSTAASGTAGANATISQKLIVTNTGNVGIGTSAPAAKLDIFGAGNQAISGKGQLFIADGGTAAQAAGEGGQLSFGAWLNGDLSAPYPMATLKGISEVATTNQNQGALIIGTSDTNAAVVERVRITSENYLRLAAGGIQFNGDTAAANALDDYEEGTWTMGISFGGASTGMTFGLREGRYTKIGRQVTVSGYMNLTNKGTSTGSAKITGLPFTINSEVPSYSTANMWYSNVSFANQFQAIGAINSTLVELYELTEAGAITSLNETNFADNSEIIISFTYFV
jgi:hypothetical protein